MVLSIIYPSICLPMYHLVSHLPISLLTIHLSAFLSSISVFLSIISTFLSSFFLLYICVFIIIYTPSPSIYLFLFLYLPIIYLSIISLSFFLLTSTYLPMIYLPSTYLSLFLSQIFRLFNNISVSGKCIQYTQSLNSSKENSGHLQDETIQIVGLRVSSLVKCLLTMHIGLDI